MNMIDNPPHTGNGYSRLGTDEIYREHLGAAGFKRDTEFNDTVVRYLDESVVSPGQARVRFEEADYLVIVPCMHK
jgi:hypothetical protein